MHSILAIEGPSDGANAPPGAQIRQPRDLLPLTILFVICLGRGFAYANLMPPWAIIDEQQHLHFIQALSEEGRAPDPRNDYLSEEIVASLFETHRWETLGLAQPIMRDARAMGVEGYSYEGYQPPLFYALMVPVFRVADGTMIARLFVLRWVAVALSALTATVTYAFAKTVSASRRIAFLAALVLILIPERTAAVSRVNNDVLLGFFGALFLCLSTRAVLHKPGSRSAIALGVVLGLGTLSKMTMLPLAVALPIVFHGSSGARFRFGSLALSLSVASMFILPLVTHNLVRFGDITGFSAVAPILSFRAPPLTVNAFLKSLEDLFTHCWVILWQTEETLIGPGFTLLYGLLFLLSCLAAYGLKSYLATGGTKSGSPQGQLLIKIFAGLIAVYATLALLGYWMGNIPVLQGRFLLPILAGMTLLLMIGLRESSYEQASVIGLILVLVLLDGLSLFGHHLPQYYPAHAVEGVLSGTSPSFPSPIGSFLLRVGAHKPPGVQQMLGATIVGYGLAQALALLGGMVALFGSRSRVST